MKSRAGVLDHRSIGEASEEPGGAARSGRTIRYRVLQRLPAAWLAGAGVAIVVAFVLLNNFFEHLLEPVLISGFAIYPFYWFMVVRWHEGRLRRDAEAYIRHGALPCPACGVDRACQDSDGACGECGFPAGKPMLARYWRMRASAGARDKAGSDDRYPKEWWLVAFPFLPITLVVLLDFVLFPLFGAARSLLPLQAQVAASLVVALGFPLCCLVAAFIFSSQIFREFKRLRKEGLLYELSRCPGCRHDLRGVPGLGECPECGLAIELDRLGAQRLIRSAWYIGHYKREQKAALHPN